MRLYINVLVPAQVPGMLALPSNSSQVAPPSHERFRQTESPVIPLSMLPHAMPSGSDTCSTRRLPLICFSGAGKVFR
ncbi:hypothetical protein [Streptosporangium sp. V21-05]|uniref:hypothetical protein n=1 Tax=Streptosporangium sp. V21-05 TaxID=3446115 RepID=UPI003F535DC1